MERPSRRLVLTTLGVVGAGLIGTRFALPRWLRVGPPRPVGELSDAARLLVADAFADVDRTALWDAHAHLVGLDGSTGAWVSPRMQSHAHPIDRLLFDTYLAASGIRDTARADRQYLDRLLALHRAANPAGKLVLLAFDRHVEADGTVDLGASTFYTPDEYVQAVARANADVVACASIHPLRADALERLERAASAGAVAVKWLPNAMGIDPASPACEAFYRRMVALDLVLLTHTGVERAVHAEEDQELGNPLRLRRPLDLGVRVIAAHCATLGRHHDLDAPVDAPPREAAAFDLFLRLMGESAYEGRLFGGLSAVTLVNRSSYLRTLLTASELHPRLVNGSDYPLPAIDPVVSLWLLGRQGVLAAEDRAPLREVFEANPLLFDYVLKRRLRVLDGGRRYAFAPIAFETRRLFQKA